MNTGRGETDDIALEILRFYIAGEGNISKFPFRMHSLSECPCGESGRYRIIEKENVADAALSAALASFVKVRNVSYNKLDGARV